MDLLFGWGGSFLGQLLVAVLLSWALWKLFGVENLLAVCATTLLFAVSAFAMNNDGNVFYAMTLDVPPIIAVYMALSRKAAKPLAFAPSSEIFLAPARGE